MFYDYNQYTPPLEIDDQGASLKSFENFESNLPKTNELQQLLSTAENLLKTNKIKEALKVYEFSLAQAESCMNKEEFKSFFEKTLKELNLASLKLINANDSKAGFEIISQNFHNEFQELLQNADELLKTEKINPAMKNYEKIISEARSLLSQDDFFSFFDILIKELTIFAIRLLNENKETPCFQILLQCDQWTQPGIYGSFPCLRIFIFNHFGCYFRRINNLQISLSYFLKAFKLLNSSPNDHYSGLTHMNISAVMSQMGDHERARNHALQSIRFTMRELKNYDKSNSKNPDYKQTSLFIDLVTILAISYHNLGNEEQYFNQLDKAYENFQNSISLLEQHFENNHSLLIKFKSEFLDFLEKNKRFKFDKKKNPSSPSKASLWYKSQMFNHRSSPKKRPQSAVQTAKIAAKTLNIDKRYVPYLNAHSMKNSDFYLVGNQVLYKKKKLLPEPLPLLPLSNNFVKTKLQESAIKTFAAPNFQKNDSSQGSMNDLNDLEKKGILSWDNASELSNNASSQEKLNENRRNFLNELMNFNIDVDERNPNNDEKNISVSNNKKDLTTKNDPQKPKSAFIRKNSTKRPFKTPPKKVEEDFSKKMEVLDSELKTKKEELTNLEQEEKRRKVIIHEKEKEIEAKMRTIQELQSKETSLKNRIKAGTGYDLVSIKKIQRIYRKLNLFEKLEANKKNLVFYKMDGFLFPSVLKNHVEQNFLQTAKKKVRIILYLQKPKKMIELKILVKSPIIQIFEHSLSFCNIINDKKYEEQFCRFLQSVSLEILNHLVLVELKYVGIREFLSGKKIIEFDINTEEWKKSVEVSFENFIFSKVGYKDKNKIQSEKKINEKKKQIEELKKMDEVSELEQEARNLKQEIETKRQEKMAELQRLREIKMKEEEEIKKTRIEMDRQLQEKEALLKAERELKMAELQQLENLRKKEEEEAIKAKLLLERKINEKNMVTKIQRCYKKKQEDSQNVQYSTNSKKLVFKKKYGLKNMIVFLRILKNKKKKDNTAYFNFFERKERELVLTNQLKLKIDNDLLTQLKKDGSNYLKPYFNVNLKNKKILINNLNIWTEKISNVFSIIVDYSKKKKKLFLVELRILKETKDNFTLEDLQSIQSAHENTISKKNSDVEGIPNQEKNPSFKVETYDNEYEEEEFDKDESVLISESNHMKQKLAREYLGTLSEKTLKSKKVLSSFFLFLETKKEEFEFNFKQNVIDELLKLKSSKKVLFEITIYDANNSPFTLIISFSSGKISIEDKGGIAEIYLHEDKFRDFNSANEYVEKRRENIFIIDDDDKKVIRLFNDADVRKIQKIQNIKKNKQKKEKPFHTVNILYEGTKLDLRIYSFKEIDPTMKFELASYEKIQKYEINKSDIPFFETQNFPNNLTEFVSSRICEKNNKIVFKNDEKNDFFRKIKILVIDTSHQLEFEVRVDKNNEKVLLLLKNGEIRNISQKLKNLKELAEDVCRNIVIIYENAQQKILHYRQFEIMSNRTQLNYNGYKLVEQKLFKFNEKIYLSNLCYKDDEHLIQETFLIQNGILNLNELKNSFEKSKIKKLAYLNFFGIDESDFNYAQNSNKQFEKAKDPFFPDVDEKDLDRAALTIQQKYKKRNKKNIVQAERLSKLEEISKDPYFPDVDQKELGEAALKIQKKYRKKNKSKKQQENYENIKDPLIPGVREEQLNKSSSKIQNKTNNENKNINKPADFKKETPLEKVNNKNLFVDQTINNNPSIKKDPFFPDENYEELDKAALTIQQKYKKRNKAQKDKSEKIKEKTQEKIKDPYFPDVDEMELEKAAFTIQKKYKNRNKFNKKNSDKNQKRNIEEQKDPFFPDVETQELNKAVLTTKKKIKDPYFPDVDEKELEKAAFTIQQKYKNRNKSKKKNSDKNQIRSVQNDIEIQELDEAVLTNQEKIKDPFFPDVDEKELEKAAFTIQKKYKNRNKSKKKNSDKNKMKCVEKQKDPFFPDVEIQELDEAIKDPFFPDVDEKELEKAAFTIQKKYKNRNKSQKKNSDKNQIKSAEKQKDPFFPDVETQELEQAALTIQKKYKNRNKSKNKQEPFDAANNFDEIVQCEPKDKVGKNQARANLNEKNISKMNKDPFFPDVDADELDKAALKIQQKYKKRPKKVSVQKEKEKELPKKEVDPFFPDVDAEELDKAALKIQQKYKNRNKKSEIRKSNERNNDKLNDRSYQKETKNDKEERKKPTDPFFPDVDEKELDKAALAIQKKYKKNKNMKKNKNSQQEKNLQINTRKSEGIQNFNKENIVNEKEDPFFPGVDEKELDKAALTIQKKYKKKKEVQKNNQNNKNKKEQQYEKQGDFMPDINKINKKTFEKQKDPFFPDVDEKELDNAALAIQKKYKKKKENERIKEEAKQKKQFFKQEEVKKNQILDKNEINHTITQKKNQNLIKSQNDEKVEEEIEYAEEFEERESNFEKVSLSYVSDVEL